MTWTGQLGEPESGTAAINAYTPLAAGSLRVTATYKDGQVGADGDDQTPGADTANDVIAPQSTNNPPKFPDQDTETDGDQSDEATRDIAEDAAADAAVGLPVTAMDEEAVGQTATGELTYSLNGPDADSFKIVRADGQIQVSASADLDFESDKKTYMVTVTATDGSGASDSIDVTITVTDVVEAPMLVTTTDPRVRFGYDYKKCGGEHRRGARTSATRLRLRTSTAAR